MTERIQIQGKERPIHFSNRTAYEFERLYADRSYLAAADSLFRHLQEIGSRLGTDSVEDAGKSLHIRDIVDLAFAGFCYGHRAEGLPVDFTVYDVADWLMSDADTMSAVITALVESLPMAKPGEGVPEDEAKKKETPELIGKLGSSQPLPQA